jgi:nicotinamidase-related amidase
MARKLLRRRFRQVLIDIDTQYDLLKGDDINRDRMLRNIRRLFAWCRVYNIPVVSTALAHRQDYTGEEFTDSEPLCIEGSSGQKKIRYSMLNNNIIFGPENRLDLPRHLLSDYHQIIFERRCSDPFGHPRTDRLLTDLKAEKFIICGVGLEGAIKEVALGLLCRNRNISLVLDAIDSSAISPNSLTIRKLEAKGAKLITTAGLTGNSRLRNFSHKRAPWKNNTLCHARVG